MSDIFISYASADREVARDVAKALQERGWSVWWDRVIPPGKQYDDVIEQALAAARCVVVLWSPASAASKWVRIEAGEALRRDMLVPALIDSTTVIPLEFSRVQAADLSQWQSGQACVPSEQFEQFGLAIQTHLGAAPTPPPRPKPKPRPVPDPPLPVSPGTTSLAGLSRKQWAWAGGAVAVAVAAWIATQPEPHNVLPQPVPAPAADTGFVTLPNPVELMNGGIDRDLQWRDHVLAFTGHITWDGRSPQASLQARAVDSGNGRVVSEGRFVLQTQQVSPTRMAFVMSLGVPGDSHTAGQHAHGIGLIFDRLPGNGPATWRYVYNCTAPGRPDLCF